MSRHDHFPRSDTARRARMGSAAAALEARWQAGDALPGGLAAELAAVEQAPATVAVKTLLPWLDDIGWLRDRLGDALALLAADPFARPPLRPFGGGEGPFGFLLAERGAIRVSLRLHRFEQGQAAPATALFVPGALAIRVLVSGGAMLHRHHVAVAAAEATGAFMAPRAAPCRTDPPRPLTSGELLCLDSAREAFTLSGADGDVLLLELAVQPPSPLPTRSYDIASGRLAHVSASSRDGSFRAMALALLRGFGRRDAAPLFIEATEEADFAARWSAMRELVALDPAAAHPRLAAMAAADPHPEIRRAAAVTLDLLSRRKAEPCPA